MTTLIADRNKLSPNLIGWFALCFSKEVKPGKIIRRSFGGEDLVIFRGKSGNVSVLNAYCPHLGAHLAEGGKVIGDDIRCPFHGFRFGLDGKCTHTPYRSRVPRIAVKHFLSKEIHGTVLFLYKKSESNSSWEKLPNYQDDINFDWSEPALCDWKIDSHPQEILENTVDTGHFSSIHGYKKVEIKNPLSIDGPNLSIGYNFSRPKSLIGDLNVSMNICATGLGYSCVKAHEHRSGINVLMAVMPTLENEQQVRVRAAVQISVGKKKHPLVARIFKTSPGKILQKNIAKFFLAEMAKDFRPDIRVWENKRYLSKPKLIKGDGPINLYRNWAKQFYLTPSS